MPILFSVLRRPLSKLQRRMRLCVAPWPCCCMLLLERLEAVFHFAACLTPLLSVVVAEPSLGHGKSHRSRFPRLLLLQQDFVRPVPAYEERAQEAASARRQRKADITEVPDAWGSTSTVWGQTSQHFPVSWCWHVSAGCVFASAAGIVCHGSPQRLQSVNDLCLHCTSAV